MDSDFVKLTRKNLYMVRSVLFLSQPERTKLVFQLVFKTSTGQLTLFKAGSIPALSAILLLLKSKTVGKQHKISQVMSIFCFQPLFFKVLLLGKSCY